MIFIKGDLREKTQKGNVRENDVTAPFLLKR